MNADVAVALKLVLEEVRAPNIDTESRARNVAAK
jgi:hypothetical protein